MHKHGNNKLRKQKFVVALLDENMEVVEEVIAETCDRHSVTYIDELVGK